MKASLISHPRALGSRAPLLIVVDRRWRKDPMVRELDARCGGIIASEAKRLLFAGTNGEHLVVQTHGAVPPPVIVLVGAADQSPPALASIADRAAAAAREQKSERITIRLSSDEPDQLRSVCEGIELARYRFDDYRSAVSTTDLRVDFAVDKTDRRQRQAIDRAAATARAVTLARDLANTPAADLTPELLAERARALAGRNLKVKVFGPQQLAKMKMGAILAVGRGSAHPPRLIELRYEPKRARKGHYALVGKGITFDSGGLSLKPAASMESMKRDMGGSATVLGTIAGVAELGLPIRLRAYVPTAENMPDGDAMRPGDVIRARNGRTIEVLNTDAEGRLVLADALSYASEAKPRAIIDFATLTGAVRMALGKRYAGLMGNDDDLVDELLAAAASCGEGLWQLPLAAEYREHVVSEIADIKNTAAGAGGAGTITAALFLEHFVDSLPWAHVDFSSTVMSDGYPCHPKGPSGFGVRTAIRYFENKVERA